MSTSIGVRVLQLFGTLALTHILAPNEVGEVGVAVMVTMIVSQLTMLGVPQYMVTRKKLTPEIAWHATILVGGLGLLVAVVAIVFGAPLGRLLSDWLNAPNLVKYFPLAIVAILLFRTSLIPERVLHHRMQFKAASLIRGTSDVTYTVVVLSLAVSEFGALSILFAHIARSSVLLVLMAYKATLGAWLKPVRLSKEQTRRILAFGIPFSVAGFMGRVGQMGDKPLMSAISGTAAAGTYQIAYNLADIPAVQVGEQVIDVLTPSLAQAETEERKRELVRSTGLSALVVFPLAIGLGTVAPTVVDSLLGDKWATVAPMLTILSALAVVRPLGWTIFTYLSATDRTKVQMILSTILVVVMFGSMFVLGSLFSPLWACAGVGFGFAIHALCSVGYVVMADRIPVWGFLRGFILPLLACVPMVAGVLSVRYGLAFLGVDITGVNLGKASP